MCRISEIGEEAQCERPAVGVPIQTHECYLPVKLLVELELEQVCISDAYLIRIGIHVSGLDLYPVLSTYTGRE